MEGSYTLTATLSSPVKDGTYLLKAGEKAWFQVIYAGYKKHDQELALDVNNELLARRRFLSQIQGNLVLETPSDVINTMFSLPRYVVRKAYLILKADICRAQVEKLITLLFGRMIRPNISIHFSIFRLSSRKPFGYGFIRVVYALYE